MWNKDQVYIKGCAMCVQVNQYTVKVVDLLNTLPFAKRCREYEGGDFITDM